MSDFDSEASTEIMSFRNQYREIQKDDPIDRTLTHLDKTIYGDDLVQKILILAITSSKVAKSKLVLEDNYVPVNVFIRGDISAGKSHLANRTIELLDPDANTLVHMSQKALYHNYSYSEMSFSNGEKVRLHYGRDNTGKYMYYRSDNEDIRITEQMKEEHQINDVVELAGKVIVFSDKQSDDLLLELKPILSGDRKEMATSVTDMADKEMKTKITIIRGQPSVIFCQALSGYKDMRELVSRCVNIGVNESKEKIRAVMNIEANQLSGMRIVSEKDRQEALITKREIQLIFEELDNPDSYVVSPISQVLIDRIYGKTNLIPTDMRDFKSYRKLLELHTLYNHENRPSIMIINRTKDELTPHIRRMAKVNQYYFTIGKDYEFISELVNEFSNTMRSGLPPKAHELLTKVFLNDEYTNKDNAMALTMDEIRKYFNDETGMKKDKRSIQMTELKWLEKAGFVKKFDHESDKRMKLWSVEIDKSSLLESADANKKFHVDMELVDKSLALFEGNTHRLQSPDERCEYCKVYPCQIVYSIGTGNTASAMGNDMTNEQIDAVNQISFEGFKESLLFPLTTYDIPEER